MNSPHFPEVNHRVIFAFKALFLYDAPREAFTVRALQKSLLNGSIEAVYLVPRPVIRGKEVDCVHPSLLEEYF